MYNVYKFTISTNITQSINILKEERIQKKKLYSELKNPIIRTREWMSEVALKFSSYVPCFRVVNNDFIYFTIKNNHYYHTP